MKKLYLLLLILFLSCKENKPNYNTKLIWTIENVKDSTLIYLTDFYFGDVGGYVDSSYVINNKFEFGSRCYNIFLLRALHTWVEFISMHLLPN